MSGGGAAARPARVRLAIIGAGLIGRRHAELIAASRDADLVAIADPAASARAFAAQAGVAHFSDIAAAIETARPDGVIVATPNRRHLADGLAALGAGVPALIEKPIADTVQAGETLARESARLGLPLLIGHHRRHNPLIAAAKAAIEAGRLGRVTVVQASFWLAKPESYFAAAPWRAEAGGGPTLINLIHDVDCLRWLCGDIVSVRAIEANAARGRAVEDAAAAILRFRSGAIGTLSASDATPAPWSWELASGENPDFPKRAGFSYLIGGTEGSLALPSGEIWAYDGAPDWRAPLASTRLAVAAADPLAAQLAHFIRVVRGSEPPLVPAAEGLASLKVVAALKASAAAGGAERGP